MRWPMIALLACCAPTLSPHHLPAQDRQFSVALDSGRLVRIRLDDGSVVRGRLLQPLQPASAEVTFCDYPAPPCERFDSPRVTRLDAALVAAVEIERGTRWRSGAVMGAAIGAGLGWLAGSFYNEMCDTYGCGSPVIGWMLVGSLHLGAWGALLGSTSVVWGPAQ